MRKILKNDGVQAFIASILCIILGMLVGYIALLFINPSGAGEAIIDLIKNFLNFNNPAKQLQRFGNTIAKTVPRSATALRCSPSAAGTCTTC